MATFTLVTGWDVQPTSASTYEIYDPADQYLIGNAVDTIKKYDGVDYTELEGGAPKGNLFAVYKFRFMVGGDPAFPHRIWYSHIGNAEGWSKDTNWIDIYPEDGGKLNGFDIQNDELIVSKDNGRKYGWKIYDDGDPTNSKLRIIDDSHGNITRRAGTAISDIHYYMDNDGMFDVPKSTVGGLTFIVEDLIKGIQDNTLIAMGSNNAEVYVSLGDVTLDLGDEVVLNDCVLVKDLVNDAFYIRDNVDARVWTRFNDGNSEETYFGDSAGKVFKLDDGTLAGNAPIQMRVRTKKYFQELGRIISVSKIGIFMDDPDNTLVTYRTSNSKSRQKLGHVKEEPVQWFDVKDAKGPFIELEFTHNNPYTRPSIKGYSFIYHIEGDKQDLI